MIGGIQLLPTIEALEHSQRSHVDADFVHNGALHPLNVVQLVAPYLFRTRVAGQNTHELGFYLGGVPLMLVVWSLSRRDWLGPQKRVLQAAACFALFTLVLAFGQYGLIYHIQTWLPLIGNFRIPARYLVLVYFSLAVAAALGLTDIIRRVSEGTFATRQELRPLWQLAGISALLTALIALTTGREHLAAWPLILAGPTLMFVAAGVVTMAARGATLGMYALVALAAADLGLYGFTYAVYPGTLKLGDFIACAPLPPQNSNHRVAVDLPAMGSDLPRAGNHLLMKAQRQLGGYAGLEPARRLDYRQVSSLQAASVRWVLRGESTEDIPGLIARNELWMEVPNPSPRAMLIATTVTSIRAQRKVEADLLHSAAGKKGPSPLQDAQQESATILVDRPGRITLLTQSETSAFLTLSESFHPGWQATVSGVAQPVVRARGDFMGCSVPAGKHRVEFSFRPISLRNGKMLTAAGLVLAAFGFVLQGAGRPWLKRKTIA
jgi:hypothetical protein